MGNHLVWFRNDLRVHDHPALIEACRQAERDAGRVLCLYVLDPHWFGHTRFGFERVGPFRRRFLQQSLADLAERLKQLGGRLDLLRGSSAETIATQAERLDVKAVHCLREAAPEEAAIESELRRRLREHAITLQVAPPNTLIDCASLPFSIGELPKTFSGFRRRVEKQVEFPPPQPAPTTIPGSENTLAESIPLQAARELDVDDIASDPRAVLEFRGGETAGLERLDEYIFRRDRLRDYKTTRNGMLHADDSSKFSPWLALGCLSPRRVCQAVRRYERERVRNESTYWLLFELLWRDYFALVMAKHGRQIFQVGGLQQRRLPWKVDWPRFDAWREGRTGFPLIDANLRELDRSGFMSNRGRQNVASFLTKNLGIDWRMGAEWFESRLIDYDPASNYGNWNYQAGVGNDARDFRWFNTLKQARQYDRQGEYVRHWLPELKSVPAESVHAPWELSSSDQSRYGCTIGVDYPAPIVDLETSARHHERLHQNAST